jgi:hypothetical protein
MLASRGRNVIKRNRLTLVGWHPFAGSQLQIYVGFVVLLLNLLVAVVLTPVLRGPAGGGAGGGGSRQALTGPPLSARCGPSTARGAAGSTRWHAASRRRHQKWRMCID